MTTTTREDIVGPDLSPEVAAFLDSLSTIPWLSRVGELIPGDAKQVRTWSEGRSYQLKDAWTNASFADGIDSAHPAWDAGYDRALRIVSALPTNHVFKDGISVADGVAFDVAAAASALAHGRTDDFFLTTIMEWYRRGHWPCGWSGHYPAGRLVVY